jgi:hypothetical protein
MFLNFASSSVKYLSAVSNNLDARYTVDLYILGLCDLRFSMGLFQKTLTKIY